MFSNNSKGTIATVIKDVISEDVVVNEEYITIEYEPVVDNSISNLPHTSIGDNKTFSNQYNSSTRLPYNKNSVTRKINLECSKPKNMDELIKEKQEQFKQWNIVERTNWELQKYLEEHKLKCEMLQLEKEKLQFEYEKYNKEFQLRVREMQWKCELDCADAEMKERIATRKRKIIENMNLKELPKLHS